jgi:drug/metabolite transporter (DMT)-like permease
MQMRAEDLGRLLLLSALWGGSFLFMRIAAPVLGPIVVAESRVLIAGLALFLYACAAKRPMELRSRWRQYLIIGAVNSAIPFALIAAAQLRLTASLAAILNATSPLFGAVIAAAWINDPLTMRKIAGLILGIVGVTILVGWHPMEVSFEVALSIGASLLAAVFYGIASVYTKAKVAGAPSLGMAVGSQLGASLLLLPLIPIVPPFSAPSGGVLLCVLLLALGSTGLAYLLYFRLIVDVGPAKALTVTFLIPIFGVTWGALFLGEQITFSGLIGCAIILVGTSFVLCVRPRLTSVFSACNLRKKFERKKRIASNKAITYDI